MQVAAQPGADQMQQQSRTQTSWRTWQSDADVNVRREIIQQIHQLFRNKKPVVSTEWQQKLPDFVRRLEELLYRTAKTMDEYKNPETLEVRLSSVARRLMKTTPNAAGMPQSASVPRPAQVRRQHPGNAAEDTFAYNGYNTGQFASTLDYSNAGASQAPVMIPVSQMHVPPNVNPAEAPVARGGMIPTPGVHGAADTPMASVGTRSQAGNMMRLGAPPGNSAMSWEQMGGQGTTMIPVSAVGGTMPGTLDMPGSIPNSGGNGVNGAQDRRVAGLGVNGGGTPNSREDKERMKTQILKQQRMLLFLRHCAKCVATECSYGENCKVGKELWKHIMNCVDANCSYTRCVHSRELLRHYQRCPQPACPICAPVKEFVKRTLNPAPGAQAMAAAPQMGLGLPHRGSQQSMDSGPNSMMMQGMMPKGMMSGSLSSGMLHPQMAPHSPAMLGRRGRPGLEQQPPPIPQHIEPPAKRQRSIRELQVNMGTSLLEAFSLEEIQSHLSSTQVEMERQPVSKTQLTQQYNSEDVCAICNARTILRFEPPLLYCVSCNGRIKKNQFYWPCPAPQAIWCQQCYAAAGDELKVENMVVKKSSIAERKKHQEQEDEPWVACDGCDRWVHMICGLFNKGRNHQDVHFLCPWCLSDMIQKGHRKPMQSRPQAMLPAEELPSTQLSDHLERYVRARLDEDWIARAKKYGLPPKDVPQVTGLSVRVVNITEKKVEVKEQFRKTFANKYPTAFPYKQKAILLFQKIEAVDVLLYVVYVQEYGDDAMAPNRRTVYLSYLDSIKYFRPEVPSATDGVALRTMVYHEILLGYMDYAKRLGMNAMYIWSCPPLAGDDYVMYCHPHKQKNPKADKLRDWYHTMLRQARARGIVAHQSTMFDTFFPDGRDHCKPSPSVTALPYFEGDFWPGEAEAQLTEIDLGKPMEAGKKGKKPPAKRGKGAGKAKRFAGPVTADTQLLMRFMESLGSNSNNMKEDFIVAHFRPPCSICQGYCQGVMYLLNKKREELPKVKVEEFEGIRLAVDGNDRLDLPRWFAVCEACYLAEREAADTGNAATKLPLSVTVHDLAPTPCPPETAEVVDQDPPMDCEIFDSRTSYLSLCQGNHYQFDTLRRAKHSSMMTLYHLHNPTEPAFAGNCNVCQSEIEPGAGWRCKAKECQDFDMCQACYRNGEFKRHPHVLVRAGVDDERRQRLTPEQRKVRNETVKRTMQLLEHAATCKNAECPSKSCRRVKELHKHAVECKRKVSGGCMHCRHMWYLLNLHAKQCCRDECPVPRCTELRELKRRQMSREQDSRRRQYMQWHRGAVAGTTSGGGA